ncbi:putative mannose-6-phosphate isomerase GmuF [Peptococcaceae bacterium CEB3]|nr:putative mannose-6-phosphate isomerase GmuF [Peptococcaceae bacterium CEB3]
MLYPLKFHPHLRFYPYGGYQISKMFGKEDIPSDLPVAESWEISACRDSEGVIKNGTLAGLNLQQAIDRLRADLVGETVWEKYGNYFPLLIKFLDCAKDLPPQVHPDDEYAVRTSQPFPGKTEAWYVVEAREGASLWCGNKPGLTTAEFSDLIAAKDTFAPMKQLPSHAGQTYLIHGGHLHALGAGNFIVEVQQNSDITFAWDWLDWDFDEARRHADIEHSLRAAVLEEGGPEDILPVTLTQGNNLQEYLCACSYFIMERLMIKDIWSEPGDKRRFTALIPLKGRGKLHFSAGCESVSAGESLLIPASMGAWRLEAEQEMVLIRALVPIDLHEEIIVPLRAAGFSDEQIGALGSYVRQNNIRSLL